MNALFLIGVSGSGKSTIGLEIAKRIGWEFKDGDDFHSVHNKEKMASGEPLVDADREPWLLSINQYCKKSSGVVIACSALKAMYRNVLRHGISCLFIHLNVDRETLEKRLNSRKNHFMPPSLLSSQLDSWENAGDETDVVTINCSNIDVFEVCDTIINKLQE